MFNFLFADFGVHRHEILEQCHGKAAEPSSARQQKVLLITEPTHLRTRGAVAQDSNSRQGRLRAHRLHSRRRHGGTFDFDREIEGVVH